MAQRVEELAAKLNHLNLMLKTHMVKGENYCPQIFL